MIAEMGHVGFRWVVVEVRVRRLNCGRVAWFSCGGRCSVRRAGGGAVPSEGRWWWERHCVNGACWFQVLAVELQVGGVVRLWAQVSSAKTGGGAVPGEGRERCCTDGGACWFQVSGMVPGCGWVADGKCGL